MAHAQREGVRAALIIGLGLVFAACKGGSPHAREHVQKEHAPRAVDLALSASGEEGDAHCQLICGDDPYCAARFHVQRERDRGQGDMCYGSVQPYKKD